MTELDGIWEVRRTGGMLPPLTGVRKRISGEHGETIAGPVRARFDVVGRELRYRGVFAGVVDVLSEEGGDGWSGRTLVAGREVGGFRLTRVEEGRMTTIEEQLVKHLDEAIAMEDGVKRMLDGMVSAIDDPDLVDLLEHHRAETVEHAARLRGRLEEHGRSPSTGREALGALAALAKLPLDLLRGQKIARTARDVYAAEHLEIAAYQLLERVATRAGDEATAAIARQNREQEEAMARRLDERWDDIVDLSLEREGVASPSG